MNSNQFEKIDYKDISYNNYKKIYHQLIPKEQINPNIYYNKRKSTPSIIYSKKNNTIKNQSFNSIIPNFKTEINNFANNTTYIPYAPTISYPEYNIEEISNFTKSSKLENELNFLKKNYITLNNDNIILREDINKLFDLNKQLESDLEQERNTNFELAKENDILNNESQNLLNKIDDMEQKISKIKNNYQKENEIMNKQIYFEEKINERGLGCKQIMEENNKLKNDYDLLKDKFNQLKEKNDLEEKELNNLKQIQEDKLFNIENKLSLLLNEMEKLKFENNELKKENENYKKHIINNEKEKKEYYQKYHEQKMKNEIINKENEEIQRKYQEYKIQLQNKIKDKKVKEKLKKQKSDNKINVIKDLQKKIEQYKTERTKRYINNKENDEDEI